MTRRRGIFDFDGFIGGMLIIATIAVVVFVVLWLFIDATEEPVHQSPPTSISEGMPTNDELSQFYVDTDEGRMFCIVYHGYVESSLWCTEAAER